MDMQTLGHWAPVIIIPVLFLIVLILFGIAFYRNWIKKKREKDD